MKYMWKICMNRYVRTLYTKLMSVKSDRNDVLRVRCMVGMPVLGIIVQQGYCPTGGSCFMW